MVLRAYYVLEGAPGVEGLVPTLRVVPRTTGVARAAMEALLDPDPIRDDYSQISTAIPSRASRRTVAAPIPRDAPVTSATCFDILASFRFFAG